MSNHENIHQLACDLAAESGDHALDRLLHDNNIAQKGDGIDVVTAVDVECERRMIARIQSAFPEHGITGEEHGEVCHPDAPIQWLLDPLDGTNNYVMAMPMFGNCITVSEHGTPVVSAFRNSVLQVTSSAIKGGGAFHHGQPARIGTFPDLTRTTISWTQGYVVSTADEFANNSLYALEQAFKRVLRTWSPSIDWSLIASGKVGAIVAWKNQLHDLIGGELLVQELGGEVWKDATGDVVIAGASEVVSAIRNVLNQ